MWVQPLLLLGLLLRMALMSQQMLFEVNRCIRSNCPLKRQVKDSSEQRLEFVRSVADAETAAQNGTHVPVHAESADAVQSQQVSLLKQHLSTASQRQQ